ncbi:MAG: type II secretion system protein [Acidobacteriota bacterium]
MKEKGFTLIEMLVVVAVLGIISAIAVPNFLKAQRSARDSNAVRYLRSWSSGQEMYRKAHPLNCYASADEDLVTGGFINKALIGGNADDRGHTYSIDSRGCAEPNPNQWYGVARRRNTIVASTSFYIDQSGVIRRNAGATAGPGDPTL